MSIPAFLENKLSLPVIAAPLFIISHPPLTLAQCLAGVIGAFPALNARPKEQLDDWLAELTEKLAAAQAAEPKRRIAPYAVNQIVHSSNDRLDHDMQLCEKYKAPMLITSLRAPGDVVKQAHAWGGVVFHDVISIRHAEKALEAGVDGLILVCAGAGGHAGMLSPFALVREVRRFYDGPIALSGAIAHGASILAAQAMGADFAYMGTRFIATEEARAVEGYKQMIVDSTAQDIVYSSLFTGIHGNYLKESVRKAGLDPDNLPSADKTAMNFGQGAVKAWKDIWGSGQGVGQMDDVPATAVLVERLKAEYRDAVAATQQKTAAFA
ncbi:nitronate monooxygenase family protein [Casimicrobium huifangae]|jgi:nitronate monooxygenase|uniref:NAD(P)H-dependent flavin oxidoreductase n=1 Tax=Casimicrobium huifangae TaxID=2591109 RepID=UPI0012EC36CF|nr:nitronate monooxygenase family protein [Casimicrobium huifangae]